MRPRKRRCVFANFLTSGEIDKMKVVAKGAPNPLEFELVACIRLVRNVVWDLLPMDRTEKENLSHLRSSR